ncbi:MAG: polysaccharide deacetylase family protein, partial [Calditrichota bacterium]
MNKQAISLFVKRVFLNCGVYGFFRNVFPNKKVSILRYHAVVPNSENYYTSHAIALSPEEFEKHVRYFSRKYNVVSLDEIIDHFKEKKPLPKNSVAFTFDDGYLDNLLAAKILHKYGAHGTFFIVTEAIGRESLLWLSEVTYLLLKTNKSSLSVNAAGSADTLPLGNTRERWKAIRHLVKLIKSNNRDVRKEVRKQLLDQVATPELLQDVKDLMLTWDQVKEMVDMGMIIGSHT